MNEQTFAGVITSILREELMNNPNAIIIGENVASYGGEYQVTRGLYKEFGSDRVINVPCGEQAFTGFGLGGSLMGLKPIIELSGINELLRILDLVINYASNIQQLSNGELKMGAVMRCPIGYYPGENPINAQSLESLVSHIKGINVVYPSCPADALGLLRTALQKDELTIFLEHKMLYTDRGFVPQDYDFSLPIGKGEIKREGEDVSLITYGYMTKLALLVADKARKEGIDVEVVDLRSINPIDADILKETVKNTGKVIIVHEAYKTLGVGAEISALISESEAFDFLSAPIIRIGAKDNIISYAKDSVEDVLPGENDILQAIRKAVKY